MVVSFLQLLKESIAPSRFMPGTSMTCIAVRELRSRYYHRGIMTCVGVCVCIICIDIYIYLYTGFGVTIIRKPYHLLYTSMNPYYGNLLQIL